jgi:hypothetical protein
MPETIFLPERLPLVFKVAKWLAALSSERPLDLSDCAVLLPTAGAGRRLRSQLVTLVGEGRRGLLPPLMTTPMGLLALSAGKKVPARTDTLLAWTQVISGVSVEKFPQLLSGFSDHRSSAFQIGESLMDLCSLLAEAGLTPLSPETARAFPNQEDRWQELESLYREYLKLLAEAGFQDPNSARIHAAQSGATPENVRRVIIAGVPDLNLISQTYLESLEAAGASPAILVDAPDCDRSQFDGWGRPDPEIWSKRLLPLRLEDFVVTADPSSEAEIVARLIRWLPPVSAWRMRIWSPCDDRAAEEGTCPLRSCRKTSGPFRMRHTFEALDFLWFEWPDWRTPNARGAPGISANPMPRVAPRTDCHSLRAGCAAEGYSRGNRGRRCRVF